MFSLQGLHNSSVVLTPLQFTLVVAAIVALVAAAHDLYEYFFNDVPFEKLWIGRLLKKLEPITSKIKWLVKGLNDMLTIGGGDPRQEQWDKDKADAAFRASRLVGPMSRIDGGLPDLFAKAGTMGQKFNASDPVTSGQVSTSVRLNAPINVVVNVPSNVSQEVATRYVTDGTRSALDEFLSQARIDLQPAAAH